MPQLESSPIKMNNYVEKAASIRSLAEQLKYRDVTIELLRIADLYERLADLSAQSSLAAARTDHRHDHRESQSA